MTFKITNEQREEIIGRLDHISKSGIPIAGVLQVAMIVQLVQALEELPSETATAADKKDKAKTKA